MPNPNFNKQVPQQKPAPSSGVKPLPSGSPDLSMPMRTASWPGLPGKAGPDRSNGVPEEKVYAMAQGLRGGVDNDPGPSTDFQAIKPKSTT